MWVFGYGSLMWGGWENSFDYRRRVSAELPGYRRAFNKPSVRNWGTKLFPCPTLNLVAEPGAMCIGVAFEFPEGRRSEVEAYLLDREGRLFVLNELPITVERQKVNASVALFMGRTFAPRKPVEIIADMRLATGSSGCCSDYILNVHAELARIGIDDPVVTELRKHLDSV